MVRLRCFLLKPTKKFSTQIGEKTERKKIRHIKIIVIYYLETYSCLLILYKSITYSQTHQNYGKSCNIKIVPLDFLVF